MRARKRVIKEPIHWKYSEGVGDGIITGCDKSFEWMLPWWWFHYSLHNSYPVLFLDFGMTEKGRNWCKKHGDLIKTEDFYVAGKDKISPSLTQIWKKRISGGLWHYRQIWFKKPLGLLETPFARSIWIDLDCEIHGSLNPLFPLCENSGGIALYEEDEQTQEFLVSIKAQEPEEKNLNSGVVVYRRGSSLIFSWAQRAIKENHLFLGDQDALSRVVFEAKLPFIKLPALANWFVDLYGFSNPPPADVLITHFTGSRCKEMILQKIIKMQNTFLCLTLDSEELWKPILKAIEFAEHNP